MKHSKINDKIEEIAFTYKNGMNTYQLENEYNISRNIISKAFASLNSDKEWLLPSIPFRSKSGALSPGFSFSSDFSNDI